MKDKIKVVREVNHEYILTQKELKTRLDLKGDIVSLGLHEGLSPNQEAAGISEDTCKYYIHTREIEELKKAKEKK